MLILVIRTIILYGTVIFSMRIMGKRQIGELQPSELVVAIMISDLASVPMQAIDIPILTGIIPVLTLIIAEVFMSFISLKSRRFRKLITGEPSIVIYNGHINERELTKQRFNINDLLEELRLNNYPDISDIDVAILETSGKLSVIPKTDARNVTVADLAVQNPEKDGLSYSLILNGKLNDTELKRSNKTYMWLMEELNKRNITKIKDVFIASLNTSGQLFIQKRGEEDAQ
ncbi:MAG: DUF421 domain-containing protein [Firmicutes bacterium]|nr:DUF421 domain-containing protein [Bacillota bacterium]